MHKKLPINIISLLMIYALLITPLVFTHTVTLTNSLALLVCVFGFYTIGAALLVPTETGKLLLPISHAALSFFVGGLLSSMLLFVTVNSAFLIGSLLLFSCLSLFVLRKEVELVYKPDKPGMVVYGLALLVIALLSAGELSKIFTSEQIGTHAYSTDSYFFTSIVSSVRQGTIFSASYEVGSPLNYQMLGFFLPALVADVLHISSHQALWGITSLFYKLLAILLWYELFYFYLKDKVNRENYLFVLLAVIFPVLLAPLHPLYVMKGVIKNFIWNGMGYIVPSGTVTYPISIIVFLFSFFLFSVIDWKNRSVTADKIFFTVFTGVLVVGKVPLYACYVLFLGIVVLKRILIDKENITNYIWYGTGSLLIAYVVFKICMGADSGGKTYFEYGFMADMFAEWYKRSSNGILNNIIIVALIICTYLVWLGIKLIGLSALIKSKMPRLREIFTGGVLSLVGVSLLASFLHMVITDEHGRVIKDNTFNIDQFIRSDFYILGIVAIIGLLYLLFSAGLKQKYRNVLLTFSAIWCALSLTTLISYGKTFYGRWEKPGQHIAWYDDNFSELKTGKYDDGLIVVNPVLPYYGVMLASSDHGKYWSAMDQTGINYNSTVKNKYRWEIFKQLLDSPNENFLIRLKSEGVKYVITTPEDYSRFVQITASYPQYVHKVKETKWIYQLD